jgi:16S rRNA (cytosine967-C5)-methyltransferase
VKPNAREVSLAILTAREDDSRALSLDAIDDSRERSFALDLVNTTTKWLGLVDWYLGSFSKRPLELLPAILRNAMRLGVTQFLLMGIPPYAAIDSVVSCLKTKGHKAYCNGVLREIARCLGHVEVPSLDRNPLQYVSVRYSYPEWIVDLLVRRFGLSDAIRYCAVQNRVPPLHLRVNTAKVSRDDFLERLIHSGYRAQIGNLPESVKVTSGGRVADMPGYREGHFTVQDEGAMAIGMVLDPRPGNTVWDVCSAPGGKATHAAALVGCSGKVLATDIDPKRLDMVHDARRRLGLTNLTIQVLDATQDVPDDLFDRVLLDAPCSGLGVLRRNPDLRWNRRPEDVPVMAARQRVLLEKASSRVKLGGVLVYSTCTITQEENEKVWRDFLERRPEFRPEDPAMDPIRGLFSEDSRFQGPGFRYLLPHISGTDGFFVGKAVKTGTNKRIEAS